MADIESALISEIAANNTAPSPDGLPAGSSPNIVYTEGREVLGMAKRAWNRLGPTVTSTGSANAQVLNYTVNPTALVRGQGYCFIAGFTNTGPMTLTVGALAATNVFQDGVALGGGEVRAGLIIEVFYDGTNYQITSGRALASLSSVMGGSMRNFLINPLFNVQQRGVQGSFVMSPAASTAPYLVDRWYGVFNANQASNVTTVALFGSALPGLGIPYYVQVNRQTGQTGTATITFGQTLDTDIVQLLAGQQVTIAVNVQGGAGFTAANVTVRLVAGTGAPTRASTGGGFTGLTSVCSAVQVVGGSWITLSATGTVPASARQLEFQLNWTPVGTAPANDTLNIAAPRLNLGPIDLGADLTRVYTTELPICQKFFQKTFNPGTAPASNVGINTGDIRSVVPVGGAVTDFIFWNTSVVMRSPPTVTTYNPAAANAQMRNINKSTDATGTTPSVTGNAGVALFATGAAGWTAGDQIGIHMTADAEIL
jgi:hypothetical protein